MQVPGPNDLIWQILTNILSNASPKAASDALDWYKRRVKGLSFAVFGFRASGKTTLIRRMKGLPVVGTNPASTGALDAPEEFDFFTIGEKGITIKRMFDPPGEESLWQTWRKVLEDSKPTGIIFVVDHERPEDHKRALRHLLTIMKPQENGKRRLFQFLRKGQGRASHIDLRSFLLLVNKCDLWDKRTNLDDILRPFTDVVGEIEEVVSRSGGRFFARACSAKYGTHFEEVMPDFVLGMMQARHPGRS